ncbi:hypothetical protein, partial [Nodularia sphaerocarpa]|uniref:hypothetical protein n=1 Tax=Nodularia sphaerocarpa TaxID=137816 RepID=UPI00232CC374
MTVGIITNYADMILVVKTEKLIILLRDNIRYNTKASLFFLNNMGNTFGHLFRITTFGESHGGGVGVI